uniref:Tnp_DDE_dom domain-containing protein n=1 Tax=Angiostrongylus cantonensis TaxID=6313 RepID=A0A0K0D2N8_ANGCA
MVTDGNGTLGHYSQWTTTACAMMDDRAMLGSLSIDDDCLYGDERSGNVLASFSRDGDSLRCDERSQNALGISTLLKVLARPAQLGHIGKMGIEALFSLAILNTK